MSSRIPGFFKLSPGARLDRIAALRPLGGTERAALTTGGIDLATADHIVENVVGLLALPLGVAVNLLLNGREYLVPMAVEEPSVIAAASHGALIARKGGGIQASTEPSFMIGQIEIPAPRDLEGAREKLERAIPELLEAGRGLLPELERLGGGMREMYLRSILYDEPGQAPEPRLVLQFVVDCLDAMGANMVNTVAEGLALRVEALCGERVGLRILSNLADRRLARASVTIPEAELATEGFSGEEVAAGIASAFRFAWSDPYRAATHNKGVMNGVDAVVLATGNDWRAIEAGAHAFAARSGVYRPLSSWRHRDGQLFGSLELPMQLGIVGGTLRVHPAVVANLKILDVKSAGELAMVATAIGLVQNFSALRALATRGIQQGHMRLHGRSVALAVGASEQELSAVVARMVEKKDFSQDFARACLLELRCPAAP